MDEKKAMLSSLWWMGWRRTPLTVKALFLSILLGILFWVTMDFWQTRQIKTIFQQHLLDEIQAQARRDRTLLDRYFHAQERSVKLFTQMVSFANHVQTKELPWAHDPTLTKQWHPNQRPPWLPARSAMHNMAYAPYVLLLDAQRHTRESFYQEKGLPPLANIFPGDAFPERLLVNSRNSIIAQEDGTIYLVTSAALLDAKKKPKAFLVFVSPMNDDFLVKFHANAEQNDVVVFINSDEDRVFASSRPDQVTSGTKLSNLQDSYIIVGKKFLDYGFYSTVLINFATLVPKEALQELSNAILSAERKQRTFGYALLATLFITVVFLVAKSLHHFTQKMVDIAVKQLALQPKTVVAGDQLLMMKEQFHLMTDEILQSRQREKARREEMQHAHDALNQSLIMVKRTQSRLVESETMASLGGLVAGVAHEINTPVGTSVTAASFLEDRSRACAEHFAQGTLPHSELDRFFRDVAESTQMILNNLLRAAELIRSFKQVAIDRTHEEQRSFRLHEYIHHVLFSLRPHLKKTRASVTVVCSETLEIHSYPGAFSQIITNLVINSLAHAFQAEDSGKILIHVVVEKGDICFRYSDNGRGMDEKHLGHIFEPFFTTTRHRGGSGLGMHIVFNLVTQTLKGTIQCFSTPNQGTTFEIHIPPEEHLSGIAPKRGGETFCDKETRKA